MSEQKKQLVLAVAFALILVLSLAGASYYLLPPEAMPPPSPAPTPTPTPTTIPPPLPTPMPSMMPTPFLPSIEVEVVSLEGCSYTMMGDTSPEKVLVLHHGKSANITLNVYSHYDESCNVSFSLEFVGWEGVNYRFYPSTLELPPEGVATSILTLEADSNAPSNLVYYTSTLLCRRFEGFPGAAYGTYLGFNILIFPTTPSYIFSVYAEESPTPTQPPPTNETTPPPYPTPIPTPPPWTPPPWEPEIQIKRGEEAHVIFNILTDIENPSHKLSLTYHSGELPEGINAEITQDPLKASQNYPLTVRSLLLTLTASSQTPEGTYEITANGSVNSITYERKFHLKVTA